MALTVEDGTGKSGADSYVTGTEARKYADDMGLTLPVDDTALDRLLRRAAAVLEEEKSGAYKGERTFPAVDTMKWPRTGVWIDGYELPAGVIPPQLKKVQCQLAFEMQTVDPTPTLSGNLIKREKVDVLETEYAIDYKAGQKPPYMMKVELMLKPLLRNASGLRVSRG